MQLLGDKKSDADAGRRRLLLVAVVAFLLCLWPVIWIWRPSKKAATQSSPEQNRDLEWRLQTEDLESHLQTEQKRRAELTSEVRALQQRLASLEASQDTSRAQQSSRVEALFSIKRRPFADPVWNVWAEKSSSTPLYRPQRVLLPDHDYSFVVNPAAFGYDDEQPSHDAGVYSQGGSSSLSKWVAENSDVPSADVDVLVIPDRVYFEPQGPHEAMKPLSIDLQKIRDAQKSGFIVPVSALGTLSKMGDKAEFTFGVKTFHIKTTDKTGVASIAVSVWSGGRPIDEISYRVCVAAKLTEPCDPGRSPVSSFRGIDLGEPAEEPSAALHIIDRQTDIVGVFRCNRCDRASQDYLTWEVPDTVDEFSRQIKGIVRRLGRVSVGQQPNESEQSFKTRKLQQLLSESDAASAALYNVLFGHSKDGQKAKSAFTDFAVKSKTILDQDKSVSSLFVRLIPGVPSLLLTPVGLLRVRSSVPSAASASTGQDVANYVGFDVPSYMDCATSENWIWRTCAHSGRDGQITIWRG
jgi:hypothetical protein